MFIKRLICPSFLPLFFFYSFNNLFANKNRPVTAAPLAHGQQAHAMPRRDDESVIIRHDMMELPAFLNGTFHRSVNAAGGLREC